MGEKMVTMEVDKGLVQDVLKRQIEAAIIANLGDPSDIVRAAVAFTLGQKVSSSGRVSSSSYENSYDFLTLITTNAIREAVIDALKEWTAKNGAKVKAAVMAEMKRPERQKTIAVAFADAVETSLNASWGTHVTINFDGKKQN